MPLTVDIRTAEGNVQVNASGEASVATLRRQFPTRCFDHLSGEAPNGPAAVRGTQEIRRGEADAHNLVGLSSSLPEPFNKPATSR
jgi:uncharacterized protein YhdP